MTTTSTNERLLVKAVEAARLLSVSEKTLWSLTAPRGPIPVVRIGERSIRYSVAALQRWIEQHQPPTDGSTTDKN
jgi:predicted DNA-binding transcriptional regulator AlpA